MAKTPAQRIKKHGANAAVPQHHLPPVINPTTSRTPQKAQSNSNLIVIAGVVASLFLFWYLHLLTLNQLTQLSGGQAMPDSLVGGFDQGFVEQLRAAMDADARGQLSYVHKTAGMLFPLIFGFTWLLLIGTNVARKSLRWALWALPLLFAAVRLWGNTVIDAMMSADTLDAGQVALASGLTVAGWALLALSLVAGGAAVFLGRKAAAASRHHGTCPVLIRAATGLFSIPGLRTRDMSTSPWLLAAGHVQPVSPWTSLRQSRARDMSSHGQRALAQWSMSIPVALGMSPAGATEGHVQPWTQPLDILPLCPVPPASGGHVHSAAGSGYVRQEFKGLLRTLRGSGLLKVVGGFQQVLPRFGPVSQCGVRPAQQQRRLAQNLRRRLFRDREICSRMSTADFGSPARKFQWPRFSFSNSESSSGCRQ